MAALMLQMSPHLVAPAHRQGPAPLHTLPSVPGPQAAQHRPRVVSVVLRRAGMVPAIRRSSVMSDQTDESVWCQVSGITEEHIINIQ